MQIKYQDQMNRTIRLGQFPKRIVSLVPSQTELLCDLGLKDLLVGVTKFCVHPHQIKKEVTVVGGTKQIHINKIKQLQPDIILCNKEENTKDIVEACEGICPVHVSDIYTLDDSLQLIEQYGKLFNCEKRAQELVELIRLKKNDFEAYIKGKRCFKTAYFIWKSPWMVAANNTFINYLMALQGFENQFGHLKRYPDIELSEENLSGVELVLLSSEPYPFKEEHKDYLKTVIPNAKILLVDGEMFSWYGSRLIKAFDYFKNLHQQHLNVIP